MEAAKLADEYEVLTRPFKWMRPSFLIGIISSKEMGSGVSHSKIRLCLTITFGSHHFVITTLPLLIMPIQILIGVVRIRISHLHEIQIGQELVDPLLQKLWVRVLFVGSAVKVVII